MMEISTAFGPSCVSYDTVQRWKNKFESGVESIKNAPKSSRPKSASRKEIVSKIKEIIEGDARFTVRDIALKAGISLSTVHLILKKHFEGWAQDYSNSNIFLKPLFRGNLDPFVNNANLGAIAHTSNGT